MSRPTSFLSQPAMASTPVGIYSDGPDSINGTTGNDTLLGGLGNDTLSGFSGDDFVDGGEDNDTLLVGNGNDTALGGTGDDTIYSVDFGTDSIDGGDGNDVIYMDYCAGAAVTGGNGADRFAFRYNMEFSWTPTTGEPLRITDFDASQGDVIDLGLDRGVMYAGALVWRGQAAAGFTATLGESVELAGANPAYARLFFEFWTVYDAGSDKTILFLDRNWDYLVDENDLRIEFDGNVALDTSSFAPGNFLVKLGTDGADVTVDGGLTSGADLVHSLFGDDTLDGLAGDDTLWGDAGNDHLSGNLGVDYLQGSEGDDWLSGGEGNDDLSGGTGNDTLHGGNGDDKLRAQGLYGDDTGTTNFLFGGNGNDSLLGDAGTDRLYGEADNDTLTGGAGDDLLDGGIGDDSLSGNDGNDSILGGDGGDYLRGDNGADTLRGGLGDDTMIGGYGDPDTTGIESMFGNDGNDVIYTADHADWIDGGTGNDRIDAGMGNDTMNGGAGIDSMYGAFGDDVYYVDNALDVVFDIDPAGGTDLVISGIGAYTLTDGVENLRLTSTAASNGTGNALDNVIWAGAGNNVINGLGGVDTVNYAFATSGITLSLAATSAQLTGGSGTDTLANIENLTGSAWNDAFTGNGIANVLDGGAGNDLLVGGNGNDTLLGGTGDDYLDGGAGDDRIDGSTGIDTLSFATVNAAVTVNLALVTAQTTGGAGTDTITNVENVYGSGYADSLRGNAAANELAGGNGADTLLGGGGADLLSGGNAGDTFVFVLASDSTALAMDAIADFSHGQGDRLDLSAIDANTALAGNQAFAFLGGAAFGADATAQVRYENGVLYASVDADSDAEFVLALEGMPALVAGDFVL